MGKNRGSVHTTHARCEYPHLHIVTCGVTLTPCTGRYSPTAGYHAFHSAVRSSCRAVALASGLRPCVDAGRNERRLVHLIAARSGGGGSACSGAPTGLCAESLGLCRQPRLVRCSRRLGRALERIRSSTRLRCLVGAPSGLEYSRSIPRPRWTWRTRQSYGHQPPHLHPPPLTFPEYDGRTPSRQAAAHTGCPVVWPYAVRTQAG